MNHQNYFYHLIKESEFLQFRIKEILGDAHGDEAYYSCSEIIKMAKEVDTKLTVTPILKIFVWYYNLKSEFHKLI